MSLQDLIDGLYGALNKKLLAYVAVLGGNKLAIEFPQNTPMDKIKELMWHIRSSYTIIHVDYVQGVLLIEAAGVGNLWSQHLQVMKGQVVMGLCYFLGLKEWAFSYRLVGL